MVGAVCDKLTMPSSGSEKFRQAADGAGGAATGANAAEDGTVTAAACWLCGISDYEVQSLLRERGEAVATGDSGTLSSLLLARRFIGLGND